MTPEMIAALFGFGGTILGAVIGAGVSIWITEKQLSASFKEHKLDLMQTQIAKLQAALLQVSALSADLKAQNLSQEQILSRLTDTFLERARLFLTFSYLFPKDLEKRVMSVSSQVNQFIFHAKTGQPIDENKARLCVEEMQFLDKELPATIREKLRLLNSEFERMTSNDK